MIDIKFPMVIEKVRNGYIIRPLTMPNEEISVSSWFVYENLTNLYRDLDQLKTENIN